MTIDPFTFGGTPAGELLVQRLNELNDKKFTRRVSTFLHHTFHGFNEIDAIQDDVIYVEMIVLWRKTRVAQLNYGRGVDTLMGSIITAHARDRTRAVAADKSG
ncbi:MAG: hypothetical protein AB7L09_02925 [Nitrospira sp.]